MANMKWYETVAGFLVGTGALNWGLQAAFNYNIVEKLLPAYAKIVYIVIGLAGAYSLYFFAKNLLD